LEVIICETNNPHTHTPKKGSALIFSIPAKLDKEIKSGMERDHEMTCEKVHVSRYNGFLGVCFTRRSILWWHLYVAFPYTTTPTLFKRSKILSFTIASSKNIRLSEILAALSPACHGHCNGKPAHHRAALS